MRREFLASVCLATLMTNQAWAQTPTIAEHLGQPGTPAWEAACTSEVGGFQTPQEVENLFGGWETADPNDQTSQLEPCDPSTDLGCMYRVTIPTDTYPNAVCSDGTPGTFYIRPGTTKADKWMIHMQGGGGCTNYEECADRWCGMQGVYSAAKMSSNWESLIFPGGGGGVGGGGLLFNTPELLYTAEAQGARSVASSSAFDDWTHVFVYYCSSDGWMGRASDVTMTSTADPTKEFTVDARGHTILAIMRKMLRGKGPSGTSWHPPALVVPDLDDATEIILTGTSAGAVGAVQTADWFFELLPNARHGLVLDGYLTHTDAALNDLEVYVPDGSGGHIRYSEARILEYSADWLPGGYLDKIDAFVDETCENSAAWMLGRPDLCTHMSALLSAAMISTPTFIRYDLLDNVALRFAEYQEFSVHDGAGNYTPISDEQFSDLGRASILELYDNVAAVSGVHGAQCGSHVGLEQDGPYFGDQTPNVILHPLGFYVPIGFSAAPSGAIGAWFNSGAANPQSTQKVDHSSIDASTCH